MVGVHGGSKGCTRCRKRKVKCDEKRPICKRCEKGGYECGGYRDLFQFDSRSSMKTAARSQELITRQKSQFTTAPATPALSEAAWSPLSETELDVEILADHKPMVPQFLNLQPFSENLCVSYTNTHLMKGSGDSHSRWAMPGITSFASNSLVRDCILALSFSFFGQQYSHKITLRHGVMLYAATLGRLNKVLGDSTQNRSIPTLESIMVLTLYEVLMGTSMESFVTHVLGLETLLRMLGPESVSESRQALELLEISRPVIVSACTLSIKGTILSAPQWKTIPWSKGLKKKSDLQLLYDVMVDQPGLIAHVLDPVSPGLRLRVVDFQDINALYMKACQTLAGYDSWFSDWNSRRCGHMVAIAPKWAPTGWSESNDDLPWNTIWQFSAIIDAQAYTAYQAGIIICTRLVYNLEQSGLLSMDGPTESRETQLQHAAVEICRSVEWLLHERRRGAGGLYLLMPSRYAWKTFPAASAEHRWMLAATQDIGKAHRGGWAMAKPMSMPLTSHLTKVSNKIDVVEDQT